MTGAPGDWKSAVATATGAQIEGTAPLSGGSLSRVERVDLSDGARLVVKTGGGADFECEARMLRYLATHSGLPVPEVIVAAPGYLVMRWIDGATGLDAAAQADCAEKLAALHDVTADRYGLEFDSVVGALLQPNTRTGSWIEFFRDQRLLYMARTAHESGRLPGGDLDRIETLAAKLDALLDEPAAPSLLHGDMWTGNILARDGRVTGFVDPAIYYGDAEMELAFGTLFGTLGEPFFSRYDEIRPLRPGFFEVRRDLYNLWHLLMHVHFFGGGYLSGVRRTLDRHGV